MREAPETHRASSAIKVLGNKNNMQLPIYPEKEGYLLIEDRVGDLYDILEKIMDYQVSIAAQSGPNLSRPRKYLEGWDFNDLATCRDIIYPRVATLKTVGKGWVDFTRAIHAITLFGRRFGEVIQPLGTGLCAKWTKMPKGMYYLAACGYDLKRIMTMDGDPECNPIELTYNILWHNPHKDFGTCECMVEGQEKKHSDLVQVLLPSTFNKRLLNNSPAPLEDCSAVIFGHNANFKWFWKNTGHPEEGEPQTSSEESEDEFHDSGIGSGLGSSTPKGNGGSWSSRSQHPSNEGRETFTRELYTVGIVCALQKELLAVRTLFDVRHENLEMALRDTNHYALGSIGRHKIVAACLPSGEYGTNAAADVVSHMTRSFPAVQFCLLVGIGGGVPSRQNDVRLGDVVVSHPTDVHPGVIQYDLGKILEKNQFQRTGSLQRPPRFLMTAISSLMSDPERSSAPIQSYIKDIIARNPEYKHPGVKHDMLFRVGYMHHPACATCVRCSGPQVKRKSRSKSQPHIHYGLIASGNQVIRDAKTRDHLGRKYNILCFEMEAAGVMNIVPSLVIRGICDYADSHKNKMWQAYASAAAAAYTKMLLSVV
ncbi:nucleoside phosphorylase domain-containing protein [Aspergillus cavernicola]|uniref:Nucleoside phosphorylase domain-containing protein n=1 Tax=Aspergillus cavernicola TaxID=176166 RepID=A0ABR4IBU7_9EURO